MQSVGTDRLAALAILVLSQMGRPTRLALKLQEALLSEGAIAYLPGISLRSPEAARGAEFANTSRRPQSCRGWAICCFVAKYDPPTRSLKSRGSQLTIGFSFFIIAGLVEVVLSAMSVEKTTVTLLKHQVLSLAQLVVYVVFEEAVATGNLTNPNLLLITELSEALMWRLGGPAGTCAAAPGMHML